MEFLAKCVFQKDFLHKQEFAIRLEFEGVLSSFVVFHAHEHHVLEFGDTVRHLLSDDGVLLIHVVNVEVTVDPILEGLLLVTGVTVVILCC